METETEFHHTDTSADTHEEPLITEKTIPTSESLIHITSESTLDHINETSSEAPIQPKKDPLVILEPKKYSTSFFGATFNLINTTVGSGILGIPFVFREVGLINGIIVLFLGAVLTSVSLEYLRYSHKLMLEINPEAKDYEDIGYHTYGTIMSFFLKICIISINFGATISYTIIIGQLSKRIFTQVLGTNHFLSNIYFSTLTFIVPVFFLCLLRKMSEIRFVSFLSMIAVIAFIGYVIIGFIFNILGEKSVDTTIYFFKFNISMLRVLGIITFAYASHTSLCPIHWYYNFMLNLQ
jgi:amino acid permease